MRLRRSLFFVAPATPAGPAGPAALCPAPPSCPRRVRAVAKNGPPLTGSPVAANQVHESRPFPAAGPSPQAAAARATPHETRDTNHGLYGRSLRRGCARVAPPKTAARTAAPASKSRLPCPLFPTIDCSLLLRIAQNCPELPGIARNCSGGGGGLSQCPRTVRRSRSASRRAPFAADPVALRAPSAAANAQ